MLLFPMKTPTEPTARQYRAALIGIIVSARFQEKAQSRRLSCHGMPPRIKVRENVSARFNPLGKPLSGQPRSNCRRITAR